MHETIKAIARGAARIAVVPALLSFSLRARVVGSDRALEGSTQALALIPGVVGQYLRRAFLARTLAYCADTAAIEFGTIFSQTGTRIGAKAYLGPRCHIGLADIGADVLLAAGVHVPSGGSTHGVGDPDTPIREQPGNPRMVRIGAGARRS
jgi:virginiamycin A acetyltransferase